MPERMEEDEKAGIKAKINEHYGSSFTTDHMLLSKKEKNGEKIFIFSGKILPKLPADWVGLHVATMEDAGVYLSIEGAQMVGKTATKNVVEITRGDSESLMKGEDLHYSGALRGYVILKQGGNIIGVCKAEEGRILNILPKSRRVVRYRKNEEGE